MGALPRILRAPGTRGGASVLTLYDTGFFAGRSETVSQSASVVVPVICDLLDPGSVLDVGCGQGEWLDAFDLDNVQGVDIAAPAPYLRHDLCEPLDLGRTFDLAICLEVGEHLPESAADTLVDTIARHSSSVVFSAAVPGQEGIGHINCQSHEFWHGKFAERGYRTLDLIRPRIANDWRVSPWYRDNIFVHLRDRRL